MRSFALFFVLIWLAGGCCFFKSNPNLNSPVSGVARLAVDETFRPVMEAEMDLFQGIYLNATLQADYLPEKKAFDLLLQDSVQLIVASRMLRQEETQFIQQRKLFPKQLKVATDAIALIVHPDNPVSTLSMKQIRELLSGKISRWNQLGADYPAAEIKVLFDHEKSGIVNFLADSICHGDFAAAAFAALTINREVIDYTATHPATLGFIGAGWISNPNDSLHLSFHQKIKVLAISREDIPTTENSYKPYLAFLANGQYPLSRSVYFINTEPRNGLCTGFTSFVAGDKGQRIILKSGILPAIAPTRLVQMREEK